MPLDCPRALLNLERVGENKGVSLFARFGSGFGDGFDFESDYTRDIFCRGPVDDTLRLIARECSWEEELDELHAQMHRELDRQQGKTDNLEKEEDSCGSTLVSDHLTDALASQLQSTTLHETHKPKENL